LFNHFSFIFINYETLHLPANPALEKKREEQAAAANGGEEKTEEK